MMDRLTENLMKVLGIVKYILILFLIFFIVTLMKGDKMSNTPIDDVKAALTGAADMTDLSEADHRTVRRIYGINANDYDGVVMYMSDSNMKVEEILIVKLKDASQASAVESAAQARVDSQLQSFEGYGPEQCKLLDDHVLDVQGNYVLFIVNGQAQEADQAFLDSL